VSRSHSFSNLLYANANDVAMLWREQERIGVQLRAIEARQATLDASLEGWQEAVDLALRFSTRCATAYHRAADRTRRLLNAALLDEVPYEMATSSTRTTRSPSTCSSLRRSSNTAMWWRRGDSNPRPPACKAGALAN
jgi:hypothetical protein